MKPDENSKVDPVVNSLADPAVNSLVDLMEDLAENPAVDLAAGPVVNPAEDLAAGPIVNPAGDLAMAAPIPENKITTVYYSTTGVITLYVGKHDFVHHDTYIDPVDGVVALDPEYVGDRRVYVRVAALFKYGRHDLENIGLGSEKVINAVIHQVYPPLRDQPPLTKLQKKMMSRLKEKHLYPFSIQLPENFPNSVVLQSSGDDDDDEDDGDPCGVVHELRAYIGEKLKKIDYRDFTTMEIRKVMYAPALTGKQPTKEKNLTFIPLEGTFHIECTLDKEVYYHGETIAVNIHISNNTKHTVRKMHVSVRQSAQLFLFAPAKYKTTVAKVITEPEFKIEPGANVSRIFELTPLRSNNRKKSGVAIDGQMRHLDTNLASTTINADKFSGEEHGIIVQYFIKTKVYLSRLRSLITNTVKLNIPFILMSKEPPAESATSSLQSTPIAQSPTTPENKPGFINEDLIKLESDDNDDDLDIIFECFARERSNT